MGIKRLEREADFSLSSNAKVKNVWNYIYISPHVFIDIAKDKKCATIRNMKLEWWGEPLFQEKYQEKGNL
jgi:hypothetical protein